MPKPVQKPHPPVILGGKAPNVLKRVARWGDGWLPYRTSADEIRRSRNTLGELAEAAGRDPDSLQITAFDHPGQYRSRDAVAELIDAGADPRHHLGWNRPKATAPWPKWTPSRGRASADRRGSGASACPRGAV